MVQLDESELFVLAVSRQLSGITACKDGMTVETATVSKVITQSRPLFYDHRTGDRLMEAANCLAHSGRSVF
jgi:hypothetical protein